MDYQGITNEQKGLNWICAIKTITGKKIIYAVLYHSPNSSDADFIKLFEECCGYSRKEKTVIF
jgi:hypothetical protein